MDLKQIREALLRAVELVEDFEVRGAVIDRDVALDKIRGAYEALRFIERDSCKGVEQPCTSAVSEEEEGPEVEVDFIMSDGDEQQETIIEEMVEEGDYDLEPEVEVEFVLPDKYQMVEEFEQEEDDTDDSVAVEANEDIEEVEQNTADTTEVETVSENDTALETDVEVEQETEHFLEAEIEKTTEQETEIEPNDEPEVEEVEPELDTVADIEVALEPETVVEPEIAPEPKVVQETETIPASEPVQNVEVKPVKQRRVVVEQSLFGDDEQWNRTSTTSRKKIIALYGDDLAVNSERVETPKPERVAVAEESTQVLGETIEAAATIGESAPQPIRVAENTPVSSLRTAISVGDRFMLIRDLFAGNVDTYEEAIDTLDTIDNLDDCIIYITENFSWRPSSEGAKLIVDLLQRKFS